VSGRHPHGRRRLRLRAPLRVAHGPGGAQRSRGVARCPTGWCRSRIIPYYVKGSKVIRQSPPSRGGQIGCAARFDCADASHVARLWPDRYLLGGRQGWNKADPSPRPSKSGHPRQRVAPAPHHDAIDHVRPLGGVAERAQQGGHAEPDGEQRVAMSGCSGDASVMSSLSALPWVSRSR
jgi:hypothetical protein